MANQRDKETPSRAIAEQPTHPVDLESMVSGSQQRVEVLEGEGPTVMSEERPVAGFPRSQLRSGPSREISQTQSGLLGPAPHQEPTASLDEARILAADSSSKALVSSSDDEPTRALGAVETGTPRLDPTADISWPDSVEEGPADGDLIGGRYRVLKSLSEGEGSRLHRARDAEGQTVVVRTYLEPLGVQQRPAWRRLREAFEDGAPLPDLFRIDGVVPVVDLLEDAKFGPVVATADFTGGSLAQHAARLQSSKNTRAERERADQLVACFERIASVLVQAHAQGVAFGRMTADDVVLDDTGAPYLDLTVAAFSDALDVRTFVDGPPDGSDPSPSGDVWWLGRTIQACLPRDGLHPGTDILAAVAQDCTQDPRPSAAEVYHRLRAARSEVAPPPIRWSAAVMLVLGTFAALAAGWIAGGGLSSPSAVGVSQPSRTPDEAIVDGEAALSSGAWLEAGQIFRTTLVASNDPRLQLAWEELQGDRAFRRALKDLKKRLASADRVTPAVRRDVEMLRVLEPESLVLKHWLKRLAEDSGGGR